MMSFPGRLVIFLSIALVGCASQHRSTFPVLQQVASNDKQLDCAGIDDELLKANAIRDAIYDEHGDVLNEAALVTAAYIVTDPITGLVVGAFEGLSASKSSRQYQKAAVAAEVRMVQLLDYKEQKSCPSGQTADPSREDASILAALRELDSSLLREEISPKEYVAARRQTLDDLR